MSISRTARCGLIFVLALLLAGCSSAATKPAAVGSSAPAFTLSTPAGQALSLSDLRGTPVLLNFWATWCGPCKEELPLLQQAHRAYGDRLKVIGIDLDESATQVTAYTDSVGVDFTMLLDRGRKVADTYNLLGVPSTFLIDKSGIVRSAHIGPYLSQADLDAALQKILSP